MPKVGFSAVAPVVLLATGTLAVPGAAAAPVPGPASNCVAGAPGLLVNVAGLKARTGSLTLKLYRADPSYLDKGAYIGKVYVGVPKSGPVHLCVPVASPGSYVLLVRHDTNGNGRSDTSDGGGMSGNPDMRLTDVISKRKPPLAEARFSVGSDVARITVVMNYVQGLSFEPLG